jgi:nucleotide-binding universal stress UspA family protein
LAVSESIVVGSDGSKSAEQAVAEAIRLAQALNAELHVVCAHEPARRRIKAPAGAVKVWESMPDSHVESILSAAAASARAKNVSVVPHAVQDDPADALLGVANDVGAAMIVVGSQGMHGARRVRGSVPNTVSHKAMCNVLIVATDGASS